MLRLQWLYIYFFSCWKHFRILKGTNMESASQALQLPMDIPVYALAHFTYCPRPLSLIYSLNNSVCVPLLRYFQPCAPSDAYGLHTSELLNIMMCWAAGEKAAFIAANSFVKQVTNQRSERKQCQGLCANYTAEHRYAIFPATCMGKLQPNDLVLSSILKLLRTLWFMEGSPLLMQYPALIWSGFEKQGICPNVQDWTIIWQCDLIYIPITFHISCNK